MEINSNRKKKGTKGKEQCQKVCQKDHKHFSMGLGQGHIQKTCIHRQD